MAYEYRWNQSTPFNYTIEGFLLREEAIINESSLYLDGSALASGIYILHSQMTSDENPAKLQVFTRKMILMK